MIYLVYILLSSWTSISELLNSFSSFLMAACSKRGKTNVPNKQTDTQNQETNQELRKVKIHIQALYSCLRISREFSLTYPMLM